MSALDERLPFDALMRTIIRGLIEADDLIDQKSDGVWRYWNDVTYHCACDVRARQVIFRLREITWAP